MNEKTESKKTDQHTDTPTGGGDGGSSGSGKLTWIAAAFVIVGVAVVVYASGFKREPPTRTANTSATAKPTEPVKSTGTPTIGGPFTLIDQDGKTVTDRDFRGQYLLIYFGYTYCPDVCPTTLTDISDALDLLGDAAAKVTPMLITVDPARDTPEHLKEYTTYFHPRLRALTGSPAQIAAVAKAYRVYYAKAKEDDATGDSYLMDHSSVTYLIGPDGIFRVHFSHGTDAETMAQRIRENLS